MKVLVFVGKKVDKEAFSERIEELNIRLNQIYIKNGFKDVLTISVLENPDEIILFEDNPIDAVEMATAMTMLYESGLSSRIPVATISSYKEEEKEEAPVKDSVLRKISGSNPDMVIPYLRPRTTKMD